MNPKIATDTALHTKNINLPEMLFYLSFINLVAWLWRVKLAGDIMSRRQADTPARHCYREREHESPQLCVYHHCHFINSSSDRVGSCYVLSTWFSPKWPKSRLGWAGEGLH